MWGKIHYTSGLKKKLILKNKPHKFEGLYFIMKLTGFGFFPLGPTVGPFFPIDEDRWFAAVTGWKLGDGPAKE